MRWSFKIARIAGIEVRVHVTFFLLLAFGAWYGSHAGPGGAVSAVILWLLLFLCVLLHEFGHALAAKAQELRSRFKSLCWNPEHLRSVAQASLRSELAATLPLLDFRTFVEQMASAEDSGGDTPEDTRCSANAE